MDCEKQTGQRQRRLIVILGLDPRIHLKAYIAPMALGMDSRFRGFDCLAIEETHVDALRALPVKHADPFDRMLAAQAKAERLTLVTADKRLAAYPIKTLLVK